MPAQQPWEPRALSLAQALWDFGGPLRAGRSLLRGTPDGDTPVAVWNFMSKPILECMTLCLQEHNCEDLVECLPHNVIFRIGLGVLQPQRIDDVWDSESTIVWLVHRACTEGVTNCLASLRTIVSSHPGWILLIKCACNIGRSIG